MTQDPHDRRPTAQPTADDVIGVKTSRTHSSQRARLAILSLVTVLPLLLTACSGSGATPAPSTSAVPKTFAPFDRPEYVQAGTAPHATKTVGETSVSISNADTGTKMPDGLLGISLETDVLTDPRLDPANSNFAEVLKALHKPVLRFGGQSVDRRFFWTSTNEPTPNWTLVPAYKGDTRPVVRMTPDDLQRLKRLADAADATVVLSVDMGHFDPARAADFSRHASDILGARLLGVSLGNEPNGYYGSGSSYQTIRDSSWNFDAWAKQATETAAAIKTAAPSVKVVGPEVYEESWWKQFLNLKLDNVGAMSYHNYPLPNCSTNLADDGTPTIARAMSRKTAESSAKIQATAASIAKAAHLPAWLTESGISSCGGSNETTKRHVSALWSVNYALSAASAGVSQVDMHSALEACKGGPPLSPICDSGPNKKPNGIITMQPAFYGMMMANSLGAGDFQKIDVQGNENVYAYAVKHDDGSMSVAIVNQNDPATTAQAPISIKLPQAAGTGTMSQMTGPSFDAEGQTRIDGQESAGVPKASQGRIPGFLAGSQTIKLPLTSGTATVLTFTF